MAAKKALDKDKIPARFREPYDRIMDRCISAERRGTAEHTVFYDPEVHAFMEGVLKKESGIPWCSVGGMPDAEYRIFCFNSDERESETTFLRVLTVKPQHGDCAWAHRDVLGAVLGDGVKRERIGDIILHPWGVQIICLSETASILEWQLDSISRDKISLEIQGIGALVKAEQEENLITVFISAQRLDALVAAVWNLSRSDAQELVRGEKVKINYKTVSGPASQIAEGDMVSVRGYGRFTLKEIQGTTRKDRLRVLISKTAG